MVKSVIRPNMKCEHKFQHIEQHAVYKLL